jgi:hypothetical protein
MVNAGEAFSSNCSGFNIDNRCITGYNFTNVQYAFKIPGENICRIHWCYILSYFGIDSFYYVRLYLPLNF